MTTILDRLRDIAEDADRYDRTVCNAVLEIVNELESAPAADSVPVVMLWRETLPCGRYDENAANVPLVRQRDHIATAAALQAQLSAVAQAAGDAEAGALATVNRLHSEAAALHARINHLEGELLSRRERQYGAETLAGNYLLQRDDARERVTALKSENFALAAGQCVVTGGLCGDESGNQYFSLQARINALEARQVPEGEVHFIQGGKLVGKTINVGSQPDTSKEQP